MTAHPAINVILRPKRSANLPSRRSRHPCGRGQSRHRGWSGTTYGAKRVRGDDPLQFRLGDIELCADGGEGDEHRGDVRRLPGRGASYSRASALDSGKDTHVQNHGQCDGPDQHYVFQHRPRGMFPLGNSAHDSLLLFRDELVYGSWTRNPFVFHELAGCHTGDSEARRPVFGVEVW